MEFKIEYTDISDDKILIYNTEEFSFDTEPSLQEINFDIVINNLNFSITDDDKILQIWGFCGSVNWIKSNYLVPKSKKGTLKVFGNFKSGFAYKINKEELPVYINIQNNWICIGNPTEEGYAVEFINNCIAVINHNNELISIWLNPEIR